MVEHDAGAMKSAQFIQKGLLFYLALIILGTLGIVYLFNMFISANLKKLIDGTIQIGDGNLDWRIKSSFDDEFGKLSIAFNDMAGKIAESKREILLQAEELTLKNIQLRQEEKRAQNYLDVAGAMMAALNANGEITLINKQACNILNISEEEALGKNWFDCFLPKEIKEEIKGIFDKLMAGGEIETVEYYENPVLTSDGKERIIAFHNTLVTNDQGVIEGVFFSGEDITLQKQAEAEQERLKEQLRQVQKMEAVGTMAGGIAHDFNNILTAILGYAEFIKNDLPESSQAQDDIDQILKAGYRAKELVGQILAFSRKKEMELLPIHPQVIIKETMKLLRSTTPTTVSIILSISEDCGMIKADPTGLHQILINLFTNAVHAIEEKGEVTVSLQEVNLTTLSLAFKPELSPGTYVRLSISDSGTGMDQGTLDRIFDPFFTTKEVGKGTGMGLSVVYGIVESHGGLIDVKSDLGRGSTFNIYFPKIEDVEFVEAETTTQLKTGTERILFIDDEESILKIGKRILEKLGYEITPEISSVKALEIFQSNPDQFDLIITDHSMPDMSGIELTAEILKTRPDMRFIVCSGHNSKVSTENYRKKGITVFVNKPYDEKILSNAVREALNGKG
jgi:PAS domain S-box-containing protein